MKLTFKRSAFNDSFYPLLLDDEHDVILMVGGGGSGKSYFSFQRAVIRAMQDKRKYLIVRKSATDLRRSCWVDLNNTIKQFKIESLCKVNQTNLTIELTNGSVFLCMGLDDFNKVKSIPQITDIVIEEASEITFDDYSQLKMRLRGNGKLRNQMVLMTNPISKANWIYKFFYAEGCQEENCLIHQSTYKDNRFINETTVRTLEGYKKTNPMFYRVYCLGEFGSIAKQIYTNYRVEELDIDDLRTKGYAHLIGLDFGYVNDPTAIIESLLDEENKRIYIIREFYQTGLLNDEIAAQLKLMGFAKSTIIADSAEQKSIEEIRRSGIARIKPCTKGKDSVRQGIQHLQQYELVVDESCFHTIEELENYSWKKDRQTQEYINEPIDEYNHALDALRYSLQCISARHQLKTLPKYTL